MSFLCLVIGVVVLRSTHVVQLLGKIGRWGGGGGLAYVQAPGKLNVVALEHFPSTVSFPGMLWSV